jgi:DinB superfamily
VDLTQWLVAEHDDTAARLRGQVLGLVPAERRAERPGGGSPIIWNTFHLARHGALALDALAPGAAPAAPDWVAGLADGAAPAAGFEEAPAPWAGALSAPDVDAYLDRVLDATRAFLAEPGLDFDAVPDVIAALARAGVEDGDLVWLRRTWTGKPAAWLIRWPLTGHVVNHVGEMLATRGRLGLNPF